MFILCKLYTLTPRRVWSACRTGNLRLPRMSWTLYWLQWISVIKIDTQKRPGTDFTLCRVLLSYETKMSQRLLHKCLFLGAASRILIPPGSLPPIVLDCGKPAALLGAADVQVGHDLAIYIHDPCTYLSIGRFFRLPYGLCIVVINLDRDTNKAIRHWCDLTGARIPIEWWRRRESNSRPKTCPQDLLRA